MNMDGFKNKISITLMDTTYVPILFYYSKTNFSITSVISEALMMFFNLGRSWQPQSETILGILRSWIDFSPLSGLSEYLHSVLEPSFGFG
jgi:hypothetical protein